MQRALHFSILNQEASHRSFCGYQSDLKRVKKLLREKDLQRSLKNEECPQPLSVEELTEMLKIIKPDAINPEGAKKGKPTSQKKIDAKFAVNRNLFIDQHSFYANLGKDEAVSS